MKDCNCIFCKIANGEIPSATLYEDDEFRVILDLNPASKGHALVLPKEHYANIFEMPQDLTGRAFRTAKKVAEKLSKGLGAAGFNIVQNNGEPAGQTWVHVHIHRIPRYERDTVSVGWKPGKLTDSDKEEILSLFE